MQFRPNPPADVQIRTVGTTNSYASADRGGAFQIEANFLGVGQVTGVLRATFAIQSSGFSDHLMSRLSAKRPSSRCPLPIRGWTPFDAPLAVSASYRGQFLTGE